jgi:hypothetical protein
VPPAGYETADAAALRTGANARALKRRMARGEIDGARKIPWAGGDVWVVPEGAPIPAPEGRGRRTLTEDGRRELARRAHDGENRTRLAETFGVDRSYVYRLMRRYPPAGT